MNLVRHFLTFTQSKHVASSKMKTFIILSLVVVWTTAAPPPPINNARDDVSLLKYDFENDKPGYYKYSYEQSDGTKQEQEGVLRNEGTDDEYLFVKGSFSWIGPDGVTYTITYEAGEDGYNPDIEQGPGGAIPSDIAASLIG